MGYNKKDVTPLLTHWSYVFLALTYRNIVTFKCANLGSNINFKEKIMLSEWITQAVEIYNYLSSFSDLLTVQGN